MPKFRGYFTNQDFGVFTASIVSRMFSVLCYFPFEYKATVLYGKAEFKTKVKAQKGTSAFSSLGGIAGRDLVFTAMFWPVVERAKIFLRESTPLQSEAVVMPLSSIIACLVSGTVSYPWQLVKTMRVTFELEYKGKSSMIIIKDIYARAGASGLLSGNFSSI